MKTFIVDSFTDQPFKGNPAGVCLLETEIEQIPLSELQMQLIAKELNLSETAFVHARPDGKFGIRYFSPVMEIPLCGHATLAASKILFRDATMNSISFVTQAELHLKISRSGDTIAMEFPIYDLEPASAPDALVSALGLSSVENVAFNRETNILLLEISSATALANLAPDFNALINSHQTISGVLVTAAGNDEFDFHSRYFWPWSGGNEDPVTGATHTFLAKYWGDKLNKTQMKSFQASARTGSMSLELVQDKLVITSEAVIVLEGSILIEGFRSN